MDPISPRERPLSRLGDWLGVAALALTAVAVDFGGRLLGASPEDQQGILRLAVAVLCLLCAYLWVQVRRTRRGLARVDDLLTDVLYGSGTKRDREAVDILILALRGPDSRGRETSLRTLRKLAGVDLGEDPRPWEDWWAASRPTFTRPGGASKK